MRLGHRPVGLAHSQLLGTASDPPGTNSWLPVLSLPMPLEHLLSPKAGRWTRLPAACPGIPEPARSPGSHAHFLMGVAGGLALAPKPQQALREGFAHKDPEPEPPKGWGERGRRNRLGVLLSLPMAGWAGLSDPEPTRSV